MQVDQFESEVESLSVQTRKKKGDKEVSVLSPLIHSLFSSLLCGWCLSVHHQCHSSPLPSFISLFSLWQEVRQCVLHLSSASALMRISSLTTSFTSSFSPPLGPHIEIVLRLFLMMLFKQAAPTYRPLTCSVMSPENICSQFFWRTRSLFP